MRELEPLPPVFETFGLPQRPHINFGIVTGASHDRFWFLSENEDQLIQFQNDRFLHNWRKVGEGKNPYPRFDEIVSDYEKELNVLEKFFASHSDFDSKSLNINQCELTYTNHIPLLSGKHGSRADHWIALTNLENIDPDDFSLGYRKVITTADGKPYGRITCEINNGFNKKNESIIVMNLTVRGTPENADIKSALNFLHAGRSIIVKSFDTITTKLAHDTWGRK